MKRVLVMGGSGMLGRDILMQFCRIPSYQLYSVQRGNQELQLPPNIISKSLDITNETLFGEFLYETKPDVIINCAAIVDVDFCEENLALAELVNSNPILTISKYASSSKLIYISTDSVFDGLKGSYSETDRISPLNNYAKSKYKGELLTLAMKNGIVIRTNIYGLHFSNNKSSLVEWAMRNFQNKKEISGFYDVYFNPVYTGQLAEAIEKLINIDFRGLLNIASDEYINKYNFLRKLAETFNFDDILIKEKSVSEVNFTAKRPCNTTLNTAYLDAILGYTPTLSEGLYMLRKESNKYKGR